MSRFQFIKPTARKGGLISGYTGDPSGIWSLRQRYELLTFPLLDYHPGAAAAYSLRSLSSSYTGPVVTVRRSSDDAEADFTASEVAGGALATWVGANDGFVKTWYDQSGNGRDATQATAGNQPTIVSSGVLETLNSKPAILWPSGTSRRLVTNATLSSGASFSFAGVFSAAATSGQYHKLWQIGEDNIDLPGLAFTAFAGGAFQDWGNEAVLFIGGSGYGSGVAPRVIANTNPITSSSTTQNDVFGVLSASQSRLFINNTEPSYTVQSSGNTGSVTNKTLHLGNGTTVGTPSNSGALLAQQLVGRTQEIILWFSDLFDNRQAIRINQKAFYNLS